MGRSVDARRWEPVMSRPMLKHLVRGTLVVMLACAVGCSGDDDDDDDENPAVGKCRHLVELYCPAILDCAVGAGTLPEEDRDQAVADCDTGAKQALDCSAAIEVSS